jgi:hypothetical protein
MFAQHSFLDETTVNRINWIIKPKFPHYVISCSPFLPHTSLVKKSSSSRCYQKLTTWTRDHLQKLTVCQLVNKLSIYYIILRFIKIHFHILLFRPTYPKLSLPFRFTVKLHLSSPHSASWPAQYPLKVKVNLSMCFNWAPRYEGLLGSGGIAPRILDLGTRWRWVVNFTACRFTPRERAPGTYWIGGWVGPTAVLEAVVKRKIPSLCRDSNPRPSSP